MAWDQKDGYLLMFGGAQLSSSGNVVLADTWTWNGSKWNQLRPSTSPPGRTFGAMAFDPSAGEVLLFGGGALNSDPFRSDTWAWDGSTWSQLTPIASPPTSFALSMVTDPALPVPGVLLVAAAFNTTTSLSTWTWTGTTWHELNSTTRVPTRAAFCLAYDPASGAVLTAGWYTTEGPGGQKRDTWIWANGNWTQRSSSGPFGGPCLMAYDQARRELVVFVDESDQTWVYDGSAWTMKRPAHQPPSLLSPAAFAFDDSSQTVVLFGGKTDALKGSPALNETWAWDGTDWNRKA